MIFGVNMISGIRKVSSRPNSPSEFIGRTKINFGGDKEFETLQNI